MLKFSLCLLAISAVIYSVECAEQLEAPICDEQQRLKEAGEGFLLLL